VQRALTARAVAREYGISRDRVRAAIRSGDLPAARLGRRSYTLLRRDVEAWIERHRVEPRTVAERVERALIREDRP